MGKLRGNEKFCPKNSRRCCTSLLSCICRRLGAEREFCTRETALNRSCSSRKNGKEAGSVQDSKESCKEGGAGGVGDFFFGRTFREGAKAMDR